ncbi:hypothetical protein [Thalassotalea marina]|uniref:Uncharacterized protein n=1 Tax=Thalassotalea marina TaxID=1673741 RepID=A0A919BMT2_9GAMM|nr:hypothetical protein [Thalassotalea marina]GHF98071.1 hypothetical protein GCM10017161_28110 [Thalassotalea marina]
MYFWKIEKLKEDIRTDNVRENDRFIYAFIYISLSVIGMEAMMYMPIESPNIWDTVYSISNLIIPIAGTFFAYKANGGANGSDFLGRFFSINFVVSIRFIALLIPMLIALLAYYMYTFPGNQEIVTTPIDVIPFQIWLIFLYVHICKHISDVKNSLQAN